MSDYVLLVNPDYVIGRGQFSRKEHKGYTMDFAQAGRFSKDEAESMAEFCGEKYTAIPVLGDEEVRIEQLERELADTQRKLEQAEDALADAESTIEEYEKGM